jgi:hypothetical protein
MRAQRQEVIRAGFDRLDSLVAKLQQRNVNRSESLQELAQEALRRMERRTDENVESWAEGLTKGF